MRRKYEVPVVVNCTKELSKEETVALLKGDTLPADIVRPCILSLIACACWSKRTWSTCRRVRSEQGERTW